MSEKGYTLERKTEMDFVVLSQNEGIGMNS